MKVLTFAAGFAAGYVLGARAGRETYEKITARFDQARTSPTVVQAQQKAKDAVATKVHEAASGDASGNASGNASGDSPKGRATASPRTQTPRRPAATTRPVGDTL
jgi:hypothetical protein